MSDIKPCYEITPLLWQGAMAPLCADFQTWGTGTLDVILVGCHEQGIPSALVRHVPFDDNADGVDDATWDRLMAVTSAIPPQANVLTVCSMGENRSGLLSAMILHHRGVSNPIDLIRSRVVPRTNQPYAFWNPGFVRQVRERLVPK